MTWEFLLFANLALLLRLRLLLVDAPAGARAWWTKCVVELVALVLLVEFTAGSVVAMGTAVVIAVATIRWEQRTRERNGVQLLLGAMQLLALSLCFGPWATPAMRPWLPHFLQGLREWSALGTAVERLFAPGALRYLFGLLIAANETNLLIRWLLGRLQLRPGTTNAIDTTEYARGRVIGLLERALIYFFVLNGQYGAVGFTLAAKGFTRFKELENRAFAEYVLIGTLLSSGLAMFVAVGIQALK